jgi:hypothetical protein
MKKYLSLSLFAFLLVSFTASASASAQVVYVEEAPAPARRCRVGYHGRVCTRPRARTRYAPPPAVVTAAPRNNYATYGDDLAPRRGMFKRWSIGVLGTTSISSDGLYEGGGVNIQYMFSKQLGIEGLFEGMDLVAGSDDTLYYEERSKVRAGVSVLFFLSPIKSDGINFYLKGGLFSSSTMINNDTYSNDPDSQSSISSASTEFGVGIQWRLNPMMSDGYTISFNAEATTSIPTKEEDVNVEEEEDSSSLNFRFSVMLHF